MATISHISALDQQSPHSGRRSPTQSRCLSNRLRITLGVNASLVLFILIVTSSVYSSSSSSPLMSCFMNHRTAPHSLNPVMSLPRAPNVSLHCPGLSPFTFVREFFQSANRSDSRSQDVKAALLGTVQNNICSRFVLLISDPDYNNDLIDIHDRTGAEITSYWSPVEVTYDRLLLAVTRADPTGAFALSTADVLIPPVAPLLEICSDVFRSSSALLVVSRRDLHDASCLKYYTMKSWDVLIGNATIIDDYVLDNTHFSPTYWGVENLLAYLLLRGRDKPYNLCPYLDVVHYHRHRSEKSIGKNRIRINHDHNSIWDQHDDISPVCNLTSLKSLPNAALKQ